MTPDSLLPRVVNSVLVTRKVIRPRKDRIARLARAWVYALTFVRPLPASCGELSIER